MADVRHLGIAEVVALHAAIMERTGFAPALLVQEGLLESAIRRTLWASLDDEDADVLSMASRLAVGISQAQAFLAGNKRTAFAATDVFLRLNGMQSVGDPIMMAEQLEAVANAEETREDAEQQFAARLRDRVRPR